MPSPGSILPGLPDPEPVAAALRGTAYAAEVQRIAQMILRGQYPLFAKTVNLGPLPAWRRDWKTGQESGLDYFKKIRYLDPAAVGDHKRVWEPARHQHLVLLAQAALLGERDAYIPLIERQIVDFLDANPMQRGMHWASALEVAFRALSWIWVDHLTGRWLSPQVRSRLHLGSFRHGCHLENNLSIYFSRNTHLLGEALALYALGVVYPDWPRAAAWRKTGESILTTEVKYQVLPDGADFEQSSYYHIYALDMFLFYWLLAGRPEAMRPALIAMAEFLDTLSGRLPGMAFTGDDDGGRLFHPYGDRHSFYMTTVVMCNIALNKREIGFFPDRIAEQAAWWLGASALEACGEQTVPLRSRLFPGSGLVAMIHGEVHILVDAGGFGSRRGGHSHSDALQVLIRIGEREVLIDPGTYTYVSDRARRNWFRSTAAHNTVRIDGAEQGAMDYPFGWRSRPEVTVEAWSPGDREDRLVAVCRYGGKSHRRTVVFQKRDGLVFIEDEIEAGPGDHTAEQFWHFGEPEGAQILWPDGVETEYGRGREHGWRSRCLGQIEEASYAVARVRGAGTLRLQATIVLNP